MIVSEFPLVQPHLCDARIPPLVYRSGVLLLVASLAIIRVHHRWAHDWTVLVTLAGWFGVVPGLFRASGRLDSMAREADRLSKGCLLQVSINGAPPTRVRLCSWS